MALTNRGKSILAILLALALTLGLAACGGGKDDPATTEEPTTEPVTEEVIASVEDTTEEPTTEEPTTEEPTTEEPSTVDAAAAAATTVAEATTKPEPTTAANKKPGTTKEIVEYFNKSANKVKTDKPGITNQDRTLIDDKNISSPNFGIKTIAKTAISVAKGIWEKWSDPRVKKPGESHDGIFPVNSQSWSSKLKADWVKSATCTETDTAYKIKIVLKDENVPSLPKDQTTTKHGQFHKVYEYGEIMDGVESVPGVSIENFAATYNGCYVDCVIDKATGNMTEAFYYNNAMVTINAKLLGASLEATLPLAQEDKFVMDY